MLSWKNLAPFIAPRKVAQMFKKQVMKDIMSLKLIVGK